ncbi:MAG: cytochrome c, partial [Desulfuromonadales bacterium]
YGLCASCHGELQGSDVCGEDAEEIMEAILEDEGGMSVFSQLTEAQIKMIAEALSSCNEADDDSERSLTGSWFRNRTFHVDDNKVEAQGCEEGKIWYNNECRDPSERDTEVAPVSRSSERIRYQRNNDNREGKSGNLWSRIRTYRED